MPISAFVTPHYCSKVAARHSNTIRTDKLVQVLLLSAQDAMLSRLILRGKAGKEERLRFGKLAFGARKAASTPDEDYMQACSASLPCSEKRPLRVLHEC